jgi:AraC-like DNA-binding protein
MPDLDGARNVFEGVLHLWPNGALFVGADMVNQPHRHFTASILLGVEGAIRVRIGAGEWVAVEGVMVAPNVEQQLDARGARIAILQIDPESDEFARIAHRFASEPSVPLPGTILSSLRRRFGAFADTSRDAFEIWSGAIDALSEGILPRAPIDPRIRRALGIIKSDFLSPPPAAKLAASVGLSPGRLIHLFTEQMGLPIRRYVLWLRLRDVVFSLVSGSSLTEAAHQAGFSDSPHLSRTFRGMFGFPPSAIAEGRGRVRLSYDLAVSLSQRSPHTLAGDERLSRATR